MKHTKRTVKLGCRIKQVKSKMVSYPLLTLSLSNSISNALFFSAGDRVLYSVGISNIDNKTKYILYIKKSTEKNKGYKLGTSISHGIQQGLRFEIPCSGLKPFLPTIQEDKFIKLISKPTSYRVIPHMSSNMLAIDITHTLTLEKPGIAKWISEPLLPPDPEKFTGKLKRNTISKFLSLAIEEAKTHDSKDENLTEKTEEPRKQGHLEKQELKNITINMNWNPETKSLHIPASQLPKEIKAEEGTYVSFLGNKDKLLISFSNEQKTHHRIIDGNIDIYEECIIDSINVKDALESADFIVTGEINCIDGINIISIKTETICDSILIEEGERVMQKAMMKLLQA